MKMKVIRLLIIKVVCLVNVGGNFQLKEDIVVCDNCNRTSDYSMEDIFKIADSNVTVVCGATLEQRKTN